MQVYVEYKRLGIKKKKKCAIINYQTRLLKARL